MDLPTCTGLGVDEFEALFKFIPSSQLLEMRQFSEACNEAALPLLRKREDLNLILTADQERNKDLLESLRNLPENAFLASGIKFKFANDMNGYPKGHCKDATTPFQEVLVEICNLLGARRLIKKFTLDFKAQSEWRLGSEPLLRMIGHFSPSLEILDMKESAILFTLSQEKQDSMTALFGNSPLNNLKKIVPPSPMRLRSMTRSYRFDDFANWLSIIVKAAPNLLDDPTADCKRIDEDEWENITVYESDENSDYANWSIDEDSNED